MPAPVSHRRKHDVGDANDHEGDIYGALVGAVNALTAANVAVDTQTMVDAIAAAIVGMQWQPPIIRFEAMVTNEPGAPSDGDRYISTETGTMPSTTQAVVTDDVCEWDSGTSLWIVTTPEDGWAVIEQGVDPNIAWWYSGAAWRKLGTIVDHANLLNLNWSVAAHVMDTDLAMGTHQITGVVDPTLAQDAATKKYVDDQDLLNVLLAGRAGGQAINGGTGVGEDLTLESTSNGTKGQVKVLDEMDMNSKKIVSVLDPAANQDAATKKYVDDQVGGKDEFTELDDTPANYTNDAGKAVRVIPKEDALVFFHDSWQLPIIDFVVTLPAPGAVVAGARYIVTSTYDTFTTNDICEIADVGGTPYWTNHAPTDGMFIYDKTTDLTYKFDGANWIEYTLNPIAHKDTHDPEDGSDPLDAAAPGSIDENANAEGTAHSFARSDHNHQHTAALHENGGGAEIEVSSMGTSESNTAKVLKPDGAGGIGWQDDATGTDEKVKSDATDPAAGFLDAKVDGTTIEVNATSHEMNVKSGVFEPVFSKNTGFNKDFGQAAGTVLEGDTLTQPNQLDIYEVSGSRGNSGYTGGHYDPFDTIQHAIDGMGAASIINILVDETVVDETFTVPAGKTVMLDSTSPGIGPTSIYPNKYIGIISDGSALAVKGLYFSQIREAFGMASGILVIENCIVESINDVSGGGDPTKLHIYCGGSWITTAALGQINNAASQRGYVFNTDTDSTVIFGQLDANGHKTINLLDPTAAQDGATKNYTDNGPQKIIQGAVDTEFTTTSDVFTQAKRITLATGPKMYLVKMSCEIYQSTLNVGVVVQGEIDDTTHVFQQWQHVAKSGYTDEPAMVYGEIILNLSGADHDFDFDIKRVGIGTAKAKNFRVVLMEVIE